MTTIESIKPDRFKSHFTALAKFGATQTGGVNRPTFSPEHFAARDWFRSTALAAGLQFNVDGAGNHAAKLVCGPQEAPSLFLGSHLDSVPNGGRFDGALGVVAALEVLLSLQDYAIQLPFNVEAIDFTDEEGTLSGLLGSFAFAGKLDPQTLTEPRGGLEKLSQGLTQAGLTTASMLSANRSPAELAGYLELHIEQGPRLKTANAKIGIVTSIVGIDSLRLYFRGRSDHAGTTPMDARQDAAQGASLFALKLHQLVREQYPNCTANIGDMHFSPGAFNIVPETVSVAMEFRAPDPNTLANLKTDIIKIARKAADKNDLRLEIENLGRHAPALMSEKIQKALKQSSEKLGLKTIALASGAGHDAQSLADICPTGMIFIPSVGGSHSSREFAEWDDCINGANVLLQTVLKLGQ
jgi:beta-ureidopropionase / N-carbamoyl-L-amino-acid hydrolase